MVCMGSFGDLYSPTRNVCDMKQTKHIRSNQERESFISNLSGYDFVTRPKTFVISDYKDSRTVEQNSKMWAMLTDISKQIEWAGSLRSPEDWKVIMTASLKMANNESLQAVPGVEGGVVILGLHTSKMSLKDFSDLIEYLYMFGATKDIEWSCS